MLLFKIANRHFSRTTYSCPYCGNRETVKTKDLVWHGVLKQRCSNCTIHYGFKWITKKVYKDKWKYDWVDVVVGPVELDWWEW